MTITGLASCAVQTSTSPWLDNSAGRRIARCLTTIWRTRQQQKCRAEKWGRISDQNNCTLQHRLFPLTDRFASWASCDGCSAALDNSCVSRATRGAGQRRNDKSASFSFPVNQLIPRARSAKTPRGPLSFWLSFRCLSPRIWTGHAAAWNRATSELATPEPMAARVTKLLFRCPDPPVVSSYATPPTRVGPKNKARPSPQKASKGFC